MRPPVPGKELHDKSQGLALSLKYFTKWDTEYMYLVYMPSATFNTGTAGEDFLYENYEKNCFLAMFFSSGYQRSCKH